jgi:hypothetical protein
LLVSPGLEVVNAMEEILPSALRPELAAALVSVFDGCGRDQNLLMWAIQREIDLCSKCTPIIIYATHYHGST